MQFCTLTTLMVALASTSLASPAVVKELQVGVTNGACKANPNTCNTGSEIFGYPQNDACTVDGNGCKVIRGYGITAVICD
ncbi:hypothetical protein BKA61DRAFT_666375 [Leptodontidium sp. MPI-SDFR-AT-0119]|nr:hypothetical protein BKA61DRAFT_666375 [Leptodontidium sp. MPI-SDFR-AT-0119]